MSSEPPPVRRDSSTGPPSRPGFVLNPLSGTPSSRWMPRASVWSFSSHAGVPTATMFRYIASAIGREKYGLQPEPTIITVSSFVSVISAAPCAIRFAVSNIASVRA